MKTPHPNNIASYTDSRPYDYLILDDYYAFTI